MLIDDYIDIKIVSQNIEYYQSLGFDCKIFDIITIKTSQLTPTSKKLETRKCDYCGKNYERQHNFNLVTFRSYGIDVCPECNKSQQFKKIRRKKVAETNLDRYGVEAPLQNKIIHTKQKETMRKKYGVEYPGLSDDIMKKIKETNNVRYGGNTPMSDRTIVGKVRASLYGNNNVPTSSQQQKIASILTNYYAENAQVVLNYPLSTTSLDIALFYKNEKIDIEYDGSYWHKDKQKDRRRDEFIKSQGYRILRIKSGHLLPTIDELISTINKLIEEDCSFKEIKLSDWNNNN